MSGGGGGGGARGAAGPVPASARKLVQGLKEIVNRPDAEIYAALRECDMDPDEAVSRLLSQGPISSRALFPSLFRLLRSVFGPLDFEYKYNISHIAHLTTDTFQEVKSKRDKKKEVKETPEPRSRGTSNSNNRATRGGADRTGRSSSVQSGSSGTGKFKLCGFKASRSSILGPAVPATNSTQKQTVPSLSANKDVAFNGSLGAPQSSSGFQSSWSGVPGQMSMADIVKMGRPQIRPSGKPMATTDTSYAGHSQNSKQTASTALPTMFDQGFPALPDLVPQTVNSSHAFAENHQSHENNWFPQDELIPRTQSTATETSCDPSLSVAPLDSSLLVANATISEENLHAEENSPHEVKSVVLSERTLEVLEQNNQFDDVFTEIKYIPI
ncbi:hypothetical protein PR202_gb05285 [Eleusine coracana subsp. coracana]|uniref:GBF-interacting protein 1 N-terminal domain-containing protein n=1 Tax=Eleusine coracana subsp. coracana TaxID=191504 RepID=A0AAV5E600_ELECO|nr:hypothetical protein PR202_gb05285 [Eleusine coracana subsp. coracana]